MDLRSEARALVKNLNQRMSPSPYDIAWMARLRNSSSEEPLWPELIEWLLANQHPDGSWGGTIPYYHDRVICTLVASIALRENGSTAAAEKACQRGVRYLWHHLHLLSRDPFELVAFELLLPTLLNEAVLIGLDVPTHTCGYSKAQTQKLSKVPLEFLYSPKVSTVHSLEFLGQQGDVAHLSQAVFANGSLGHSPATTAYYLLLSGGEDERALNYLDKMREQIGHVIYLYPFRTFELTWVLYTFSLSCPITEIVPVNSLIWKKLYAELTDGEPGAGLDVEFGIPDGDVTSVTSYLLRSAGYDIPTKILERFEDKDRQVFRTYDFERNVSVSTNVHALDALRLMPDYPQNRRLQEKILLMLLDQRVYNMYWVDKWHASPYYVTSHALITFLKEENYITQVSRETLDWFIHLQHPDGSWGFFGQGTAEETAYVLMTLLHYYKIAVVDEDVIHRGVDYLLRSYGDPTSYPELWLGKDLFIPYDVVQSAIIAALILYTDTFNVKL